MLAALLVLVTLALAALATLPVWSGGAGATPNERTEAVLTETRDPADPERMTGRFDVTLAVLGQTGSRTGPQRASIDTALAWARARSPLVEVRAGGGARYSAGDRPLAGVTSWPRSGITFRPRFTYEPVRGPLPAAWWVRLRFDRTYPRADAIASQIGADVRDLVVEQDDDTPVLAVQLGARRDESVIAAAQRITRRIDGPSASRVFARELGKTSTLIDAGITFSVAGSGPAPTPAAR